MYTTLPAPPPSDYTLRYGRTNFCGMSLLGAPDVGNGTGDPSCIFVPHLPIYPATWQDKAIDAHLDRGFDRALLSWPDARALAGYRVQDYVDLSQRVADAGLKPAHMLLSKYYDPADPDPASLDAVIDALMARDLMPLVSPFWEGNLFISPEHMPAIIRHVAKRIGRGLHLSTLLAVHFSPHYAAWQIDRPGGSGADFWNAEVDGLRLSQIVSQLWYQADPDWSAGMTSARLVDVLVRLVAGGTWNLRESVDVVYFERSATKRFAGQITEAQSDLDGLQACCTPGPMPIMGYWNGGRQPDGWTL